MTIQDFSAQMNSVLLKNATIINEGATFKGDLLIRDGRIARIASSVSGDQASEIIECENKIVIPGCIDDQVHFREPGSTWKADMASEARAAVLGGVTSFMDMPNNTPPATTSRDIAVKKDIARRSSVANFGFYLGATPDNLEEIKSLDPREVCGVKVFMGSSTGTLLVDREDSLRNIFRAAEVPVVTHCEDNEIISKNTALFREKYGEDGMDASMHPLIRSREACLKSTSLAVALAKETGARLHVLHLSTAEELSLFEPWAPLPVSQRQITCEVCVHHLFFNDTWYGALGNRLKCNPAVKTEKDRQALVTATRTGLITCIATDHAPHTAEEKNAPYSKAPGGLPLIQFALPALLELVKRNELSLEDVVAGYCHNPAIRFNISKRGFIREGYWADLAVIDPEKPQRVTPSVIASKCGWSPFTGLTFSNSIIHTFVNGNQVVHNGVLANKNCFGTALRFDR